MQYFKGFCDFHTLGRILPPKFLRRRASHAVILEVKCGLLENDLIGGWLPRRNCRRFSTCDNTQMQISPLSRVTATLRGNCDSHKLDYDHKETAKSQDALKRRAGLTYNFPLTAKKLKVQQASLYLK